MSRLDRADRFLGCLLWKPLTFVLVLATVGCLWAGIAILRDTTGPERWAGLALAIAGALLFGTGAVVASRKRRISEIDP